MDLTSRMVIETVLRHGPLPRTGIARRTGLSSGSLTRLANPLVAAGYLREGAPLSSQHGRPSVPLEAADEAALFVGVKVVRGALHTVLTGLCADVHTERVRQADTSTLESTATAIAELIAELPETTPPTAIGVAVDAAVDPLGTVRAASRLGWPEGNLSSLVSAATGVRCTVAHDMNCLTLLHHWFGPGRGTENLAVVTIEAGIGSGAVVGDRVLAGHQGVPAMMGTAWCSTGQGFPDILTTDALARDISEALGEQVQPADLEKWAGHPQVGPILDRAADVLGELVALACLAWCPQRVLLGGETIGLLASRSDRFESSLARFWPTDFDSPQIIMTELDVFDWARGAAASAIRLSLTA